MTAVTSQTERAPGSSSAQAWRYSAHELGAIDLIARERLRSCRDDVAWGDLWPSFDRLRFGLRSVVNAAKHALVIAPGGAGLAVEKELRRAVSPPSLMTPLTSAPSNWSVARMSSTTGRVGAVTSITGRKQKGRPKAAPFPAPART